MNLGKEALITCLSSCPNIETTLFFFFEKIITGDEKIDQENLKQRKSCLNPE